MKENYRKAAHVMYELGSRLGLELVSVAGLRRQSHALLATINSLKLVSVNYRWVVRPGAVQGSTTPKRGSDGEEKVEGAAARLEVVELGEIEKELVLVQARLKLVKSSSSGDLALPIAPGLGAPETVALLTGASLYWDAVTICSTFSLPRSLVAVVEGLASRSPRQLLLSYLALPQVCQAERCPPLRASGGVVLAPGEPDLELPGRECRGGGLAVAGEAGRRPGGAGLHKPAPGSAPAPGLALLLPPAVAPGRV